MLLLLLSAMFQNDFTVMIQNYFLVLFGSLHSLVSRDCGGDGNSTVLLLVWFCKHFAHPMPSNRLRGRVRKAVGYIAPKEKSCCREAVSWRRKPILFVLAIWGVVIFCCKNQG